MKPKPREINVSGFLAVSSYSLATSHFTCLITCVRGIVRLGTRQSTNREVLAMNMGLRLRFATESLDADTR
jgi:hypothetical protein